MEKEIKRDYYLEQLIKYRNDLLKWIIKKRFRLPKKRQLK